MIRLPRVAPLVLAEVLPARPGPGLGTSGAAAEEPRGRGAAAVEPELQTRIDEAIARGAAWLRGAAGRGRGLPPGVRGRPPAQHLQPHGRGAERARGADPRPLRGVGGGGGGQEVPLVLPLPLRRGEGLLEPEGERQGDGVHRGDPDPRPPRALRAGGGRRGGEAGPVREPGGAPGRGRARSPPSERKWIEELVAFLVGCQVKPAGGWRYPGNPGGLRPGGHRPLQHPVRAPRPGRGRPLRDRAAGRDVAAGRGPTCSGSRRPRGSRCRCGSRTRRGSPGRTGAGKEGVPRFLEAAKAGARGWCYLPGPVRAPQRVDDLRGGHLPRPS